MIQAALDAQGLIPHAAVAGLLATRDTHASFMQVDVNAAGSTMDKRRKTYEATLADAMKLLADFGYIPPDELDAGPGQSDYTPGRAAADGAALDAIVDDVTANGADLATLPAITATLDQIARLNAAEAAGATLTHDQQLYRQQFYDALGPESLARLEGTITAAAPTQTSLDTTLATAANGITNLSRYQDGAHVPQAVTALLPGQTGPDGTLNRLGTASATAPAGGSPPPRAAHRNPDGTWEIGGLADYQGITGLLDNATAPAGSELLTTLGRSALDATRDLNLMTAPPPEDPDSLLYGNAEHAAVTAQITDGYNSSNAVLGQVATDATASQNLLTDPEDRHVLLADRRIDSAGAAIIDTATRPHQPTEINATRSAQLSRNLFTELGDNPTGWRELIPKGSEVSNALTELAADRIATFAYSPELGPGIATAVQNPDGTWTADVRLNSRDENNPGGDERVDYLKFLATGADLNSPDSDPDMRRIHAAADHHITQNLRDALTDGSSPTVISTLTGAGNLTGVIDRSQYEALIDQGTTADQAAARVAQDGATAGTTAVRVAERIAAVAVAVTSALPGAIAPYVKDSFNAFFDSAILGVPEPPRPQTEGQAAALLAHDNATYHNQRDYLIVAALADTGRLPDTLPPTLFDNGALRPFEDLAAQPDGDPYLDLGTLAAGTPPGVTDWANALLRSNEQRDQYFPNGVPYLPETPQSLPTPSGLTPRPGAEATP